MLFSPRCNNIGLHRLMQVIALGSSCLFDDSFFFKLLENLDWTFGSHSNIREMLLYRHWSYLRAVTPCLAQFGLLFHSNVRSLSFPAMFSMTPCFFSQQRSRSFFQLCPSAMTWFWSHRLIFPRAAPGCVDWSNL